MIKSGNFLAAWVATFCCELLSQPDVFVPEVLPPFCALCDLEPRVFSDFSPGIICHLTVFVVRGIGVVKVVVFPDLLDDPFLSLVHCCYGVVTDPEEL